MAVVREGGTIELWMTGNNSLHSVSFSSTSSSSSSVVSTVTLTTTTAPVPQPSPVMAPTSNELLASWTLLASVPGTTTITTIRNGCWIPLKSRTYPGWDGYRLFISSLNGHIYEVDWVNGRLISCAESHAGSIWYIASYPLSFSSSSASASETVNGAIIAAGCEDGSVRLYRAYAHARDLEFLVSCPGTDGRILCLDWHSTLPIVFAGTANGIIKGWDYSNLIQTIIGQQQTAQQERTKLLAKKAIEQKKKKNEKKQGTTASSDDSDSSSDDSNSSDDDDFPISTSTSLNNNNNVFVSRSGQHIGPRALVRMELDSFASVPAHKVNKAKKIHTARLVWSIVVLNDFTVLTGDSKGEINAWNGRTGTLESTIPLIRTEGDILSLGRYEDKFTGNITIAAGASDARVFILTRNGSSSSSPSTVSMTSSPVSKPTKVDPILAAEATRWIHAGTHTAHASDVRSVVIGTTANTNNTGSSSSGTSVSNLWIATGAADAQIAITRLHDILYNNLTNQPRLVSYFGQGSSQQLVSFAKYVPLVASYHNNMVQLYNFESKYSTTTSAVASSVTSGTKKRSNASVPSLASNTASANYNLLLEINTPTVADTVPETFPSTVGLSSYGSWLSYSSSGKPLRLVALQYEYGSGNTTNTTIQAVKPTYVALPERLVSILANNCTISHVQFLSYKGNNKQESSFLLMITGNRLHVCLCTQEGSKNDGDGSVGSTTGKKRSRNEKDNEDTNIFQPICRYLYSLPIPYTHSETIVVPAAFHHENKYESNASKGRRRSGTQDSLGVDSLYGGNDADDTSSSDDDDDDNAQNNTNTGKINSTNKIANIRRSNVSRPMTNAITLPLQLTAELTTNKNTTTTTSNNVTITVAVSTSSRHIHIYSLTLSSGSLVLTLPRLPIISTALTFTRSKGTNNVLYLIIALKDGTLSVYDPLTGRIVQPYSGLPGDKSRFSKGFLNNNLVDPIHTLIPLDSEISLSSVSSNQTLSLSSTGNSNSSTTKSNNTIPLAVSNDSSSSTSLLPFDRLICIGNSTLSVVQYIASSGNESKDLSSSTLTTSDSSSQPLLYRYDSRIYPKYFQHHITGTVGYYSKNNDQQNTSVSALPELAMVEVPWKDIAAQVLPVTAPRRKYGT